MKFLETFKYQIHGIICGIALILMGVLMWHDFLPTAIGSAFLLLSVAVILDNIDTKKES